MIKSRGNGFEGFGRNRRSLGWYLKRVVSMSVPDGVLLHVEVEVAFVVVVSSGSQRRRGRGL